MKDGQSNLHTGLTELGDVSPAVFREQLHQLADWIADYRETIGERPVGPNAKPGAILAALPAEPPEEGESFEKILTDIDRVIVPGLVHWGHPLFMGYFGWTTTAPGILGEIITAPLNVNAMTWRTSPAATELETLVIDWLRQWLHLPEEFDGVVYDTASVGIMHALAVAREQAAPSTRKLGLAGRADVPRFRIYTSDQAHSSVEKAAIALGLGEENVRRVPSDAEFRMEVTTLREMIAHDPAGVRSAVGGVVVDDDDLAVLRQMHIQLACLCNLPPLRKCGQRVFRRRQPAASLHAALVPGQPLAQSRPCRDRGAGARGPAPAAALRGQSQRPA